VIATAVGEFPTVKGDEVDTVGVKVLAPLITLTVPALPLVT
jgi:hypothetical protein